MCTVIFYHMFIVMTEVNCIHKLKWILNMEFCCTLDAGVGHSIVMVSFLLALTVSLNLTLRLRSQSLLLSQIERGGVGTERSKQYGNDAILDYWGVQNGKTAP